MTLSLPLVRVGIPWRESPDRIPAFERTKSWYERHGLTVFAADEKRPQLHFNIAAARNHLVKTVIPRSDVYILSDADTIPEWAPLKEAVLAVAHGSPYVHLPYNLYRHEGTDGFVEGACSGVLVFSYETWAALAGQDEQFRGWGFEDTAFALAHETLLGPLQRHKGVATAASHIPARRDRTSVNRRRWTYYRAAYGDPVQMRALVGEPWPVSQIAVPFHDDDDKRTMVAPTGWSTPTEHSYPAVEEEVGEAYRAVIAETPVGASRGGLPFPAGPLDPGALESALATEVGLAVVTPEPAKGPLVSPELYQHVPELNPETQKPPFKFELNADKLRDGLPAETLAAMDEGQKAIDAFVRSVAVATDGMSDEQAQAYLDAALERQFGKSDLEPPLG